MAFLTDEDIRSLVSAAPQLAENVKSDGTQDRASAIQACSLDLTIGDIFIPGEDEGRPGSTSSPETILSLDQGHTAIIRTNETLNFPPDIGAIGFPPSSVSIKGLLMTNPGHIDPGYKGHLHFTVINMARKPMELRRGDKIVTLLLFKLPREVGTAYDKRTSGGQGGGPIKPELLSRLSHDFLAIGERAQKAANSAVVRAEFLFKVWIPLVTGLIAIIGTYWAAEVRIKDQFDARMRTIEQMISRLDGRISGIGGHIDLGNLESRLKALEDAKQTAQ
jgi:deoxycytidine triphosphate deaminase